MKQTLPEHLKENDNLRQIFLSQKGGIMKYLAEHLDANGTADLFSAYQNHCAELFFEKNKWDLHKIWVGDEMKRAALGEMEHIWNELKYQRDLEPVLAGLPVDVTEIINDFTEQYLTYAYKQNRLRWHPEGLTYTDIYKEVIESYSPTGLASKCMKLILSEHHIKGKVGKTERDRWNEFLIRKRYEQLTLGVFAQMRKAVAEMLNGKSNEQCRQMALDTMDKVRGFSQIIYTDIIVQSLRDIDFADEADQRERDGKWLRDVTQRAVFEELSDNVKIHSMKYYFAIFVNLLADVGRIWAAQLLAHGIDMRELEEEACCILIPDTEPFYYVDKYYSNDLPGSYCITNIDYAKQLLAKMGHKPTSYCYLEVVDKSMEADVRTKLSKAYNSLVEEGFLNKGKTKQIEFVEVLMSNKKSKIIWQSDPTRKFLKTFIHVILGLSKKYPYSAILKATVKGKQWFFVEQHFFDEDNNPIIIKSNSTNLGLKDIQKFERILLAIYGSVKK